MKITILALALVLSVGVTFGQSPTEEHTVTGVPQDIARPAQVITPSDTLKPPIDIYQGIREANASCFTANDLALYIGIVTKTVFLKEANGNAGTPETYQKALQPLIDKVAKCKPKVQPTVKKRSK